MFSDGNLCRVRTVGGGGGGGSTVVLDVLSFTF